MRRTPEDLIEDIKSYAASNFFNEPLTGILEEAADTIEALLHERNENDDEGILTNGDVIKHAMEELFDKNKDMGFIAIGPGRDKGSMTIAFSKDWWRAAYETGKWDIKVEGDGHEQTGSIQL